ncbi:DUF4270 family protein [Fulvivirgaceae bacterium BMA10]|uniref:DUF4270 family protein n=1 Tax=Splendidivirga corallicola TaxID=3051826 RepID=A0ABT8KZ79_9BACT|nr:DUF4270 family protein [Fulvivirgaceae bacterium BMA10]
MFKKAKLFWLIATMNIVACTEEEPTIGLQFIDQTSFELASVDTITLEMSTVLLDSVPTSNAGQLLIGQYNDPDFGLVKASSYFKYETITKSDLEPEDVRYDSAMIHLSYTGYNYNDTTLIQTFRIYELAEEMKPNEDDNLYYNTSSFAIKYEDGTNAPIGELNFIPHPHAGEEIEIRISDRLGSAIFNEIFDSDNSLSTEFSDFSHGFRIETDDNGTAILGLNTDVQFVIYYTDFTTIPSRDETIVLTSQGQSFTNMELDRNNELIRAIVDGENELNTTDAGNLAYMMGGVGLGIRIDLPYVKNILLDNPNIAIDNVWLSLKPALKKYNSNRPLPDTLQYTIVNHDNDAIFAGEAFPLFEDDEFDQDTQYLFSIKDFVELQLSIQEENKNGILITLTSGNNYGSLENLIVGDTENDEYESNMMLNLIQVKND